MEAVTDNTDYYVMCIYHDIQWASGQIMRADNGSFTSSITGCSWKWSNFTPHRIKTVLLIIFATSAADPVTMELLKAIRQLKQTSAPSPVTTEDVDDNASFFKSKLIKIQKRNPDNQLLFQQEMLGEYGEILRRQNTPAQWNPFYQSDSVDKRSKTRQDKTTSFFVS